MDRRSGQVGGGGGGEVGGGGGRSSEAAGPGGARVASHLLPFLLHKAGKGVGDASRTSVGAAPLEDTWFAHIVGLMSAAAMFDANATHLEVSLLAKRRLAGGGVVGRRGGGGRCGDPGACRQHKHLVSHQPPRSTIFADKQQLTSFRSRRGRLRRRD